MELYINISLRIDCHFNHKENMKTLFTITSEDLQTLIDCVNKGLYLKKADKGLPEMPQATDALQIDNWREDCENRIKILSEENEMLQKRCERIELHDKAMVIFNDEQRNAQELVNILKNQLEAKDRKVKKLTKDVESYENKMNTVIEDKRWIEEKKVMFEKENAAFKRQNKILETQNELFEQKSAELGREINTLRLENKLLKEKNSEWEALYASGFAGSAVVESDEGAKVVNSDAARENENYKKEIEDKETLINDLSNKLKNQSIPMSAIIEGFRTLALIDTKEVVLMVFKSLGIILSKCNAWTNSQDEILRIFVEQKTPSSGTVNNYYGSGANHFDYHRELTIKNEDNKSLEKK